MTAQAQPTQGHSRALLAAVLVVGLAVSVVLAFLVARIFFITPSQLFFSPEDLERASAQIASAQAEAQRADCTRAPVGREGAAPAVEDGSAECYATAERAIAEPPLATAEQIAAEDACASLEAFVDGRARLPGACSPRDPTWTPDATSMSSVNQLASGMILRARRYKRLGEPTRALESLISTLAVLRDLRAGAVHLAYGPVAANAALKVLAEFASVISTSTFHGPQAEADRARLQAMLSSLSSAEPHPRDQIVSDYVSASLHRPRGGTGETFATIEIARQLGELDENCPRDSSPSECVSGFQRFAAGYDEACAERVKEIPPGYESTQPMMERVAAMLSPEVLAGELDSVLAAGRAPDVARRLLVLDAARSEGRCPEDGAEGFSSVIRVSDETEFTLRDASGLELPFVCPL